MATGDILSCSFETEANGLSYALVTVAGYKDGGTYAWGYGTNNDPTNAKVVFTVSSPGYDATGASTTLVRTVYGTRAMRKASPNEAVLDETEAGGNLQIKVALSDFVYAGDTATVDIAAGWYTDNGTGGGGTANALANDLAVTNNATNDYPQCIGQFVTVPYQRVTGNFTVEIIAAQKFARNCKPVACVVVTATDQHSHTATATVTAMTKATAGASGIPVPVYSATVDVSTFTDGDTITVNFKAYPWVGDSGSVLDSTVGVDGVAQPDERLGPLAFLLDVAGTVLPPLYCVVDSATGTAAGTASTTLATAEADPFDTIANAKAEADNTRANGENVVIYLVDNGGTGYQYPGSGFAWNQTSPSRVWTTITYHPTLGSLANAPITSGSNTASNGKIRIKAKLAGSTVGFLQGNVTTGLLWLDTCTVAMTGNPSAYAWRTSYSTNCTVTSFTPGFVAYSTYRSAWKLLRGHDLTGLSAVLNVAAYCIVGCDGKFAPVYVASGNAAGEALCDGSIIAFNKIREIATVDTRAATSYARGLLIAGNVIVKKTATTQSLSLGGDSSTTNDVDHVLLWHNSVEGTVGNADARINVGYNDTGTNAPKRRNWSQVGNSFCQWNNKDDTFAPADPARTGAWPVGYNLGSYGNAIESFAFQGEFDGLYTKTAANPAYTDAANGDLTPGVGSDLFNRIPSGMAVLPYDINGRPIDNTGLGDAGAIQETPSINVTGPSAFTLFIGESRDITWAPTNTGGPYKITLSRDGGAAETIVASTSGTDAGGGARSYAWTVTGPAASSAVFRVELVSDSTVYDEPASASSIAAASATGSFGSHRLNRVGSPPRLRTRR